MDDSWTTEFRNPRTTDLDLLETAEIVRLINEEDDRIASAVHLAIPQIAEAVDRIAERLARGARLIYVGAGTSGRLGVLDAVEAPPTFGVPSEMVQAVLAGGYEACYRPIESAEDDPEKGASDLKQRDINASDAVVGIAASGRTPYTLGAMGHARELGALTVGISCNRNSPLSKIVELAIEVEVGPEVIAGSTRMKAGTTEKMILNIVSTATMVTLGHVYSNFMVNLQVKNKKLHERAVAIVAEATGVTREAARSALKQTGEVKSAIVMLKAGCNPERAVELIQETGNIRRALDLYTSGS